jgi:beta-glucosidase
MTLDEKLSFVSGRVDPEDRGAAGYVPGVARLGIPPLRLTDGPAGVRSLTRTGSTAMPAPVQLASTFDDGLAREYGAVMGRDTRAWGMDVLLGPMVNTIRVPFAGRNFETFSEDPFLTSRMGAAETRGIQDEGAIATVKHFAANNQEADRATVDARVSDQTLREIELPGYEAAIDAGAGAVMCAYNSVNGRHNCGNSGLLQHILKKEWGFTGWVMSDWGAARAATDLTAGLDQEMYNIGPTKAHLTTELKDAIEDGRIPESTLDGAVTRIVGQMERFGLLDGAATARPQRDAASAAKVAQTVAEKGAVLLKNDDGALPLTDDDRSLGLIGPTAKTPKIGGGGSAKVVPESAASPLDTIAARAGAGVRVEHAMGIDLEGAPIPASDLSPASPLDADGSATVAAGKSLSYSGTLTVPTDGDYTFIFTPPTYGPLTVGDGALSLFCILEACSGTVHLTAGTHKLSFTGINGMSESAPMRLTWVTPESAAREKAEAVALAKRVATPIVFAYDEGTESSDRSTLTLPAHQDELIEAVADANPNTVVVLNTGSSITMPWLADVDAVLDMYYPGQNGAEATARLLYGDVNPAGRLTQTFPATDEQTPFAGDPSTYPGVDGVEHYAEGIFVGYRWYDRENVDPLFSFGHGLSYTSFSYSDLAVAPSRGGLEVSFNVRNTGARAGAEVPQVYVGGAASATAPQARRALAGYERIELAAGQTRRVTIPVAPRQLSHWSTVDSRWSLPADARTVSVGSSSRDLRLTGVGTPGEAPPADPGPQPGPQPAPQPQPQPGTPPKAQRPKIGRPVLVRSTVRVSSTRRAGLRVRCGRSRGRDCRGTLTLSLRGKRLGRTTFAIRADRASTVRVRLTTGAYRTLMRRGRYRVVATVRTRGADGVTRALKRAVTLRRA